MERSDAVTAAAGGPVDALDGVSTYYVVPVCGLSADVQTSLGFGSRCTVLGGARARSEPSACVRRDAGAEPLLYLLYPPTHRTPTLYLDVYMYATAASVPVYDYDLCEVCTV